MQMTISNALRIFGVLICLGLAVVVTLSTFALTELEVTGPVYTKIAFGQGLIGDIEPPPLYVVEAFLDASLAARDPANLATYKAELTSLHQQYDTRHSYWASAPLPPDISKELNQDSDADVQKFWTQLENVALPAIQSGNSSDITVAMDQLNQIYQAHRTIVQDIVNKANAFDDANQQMAAGKIKLYTTVMFGASFIVFIGVVFGLFGFALKVIKPVNKMGEYMTALAGGDFEQPIPYQTRKDEIGNMVRAVDIFRSAILSQRVAEASLAEAHQAAELDRVASEAAREAGIMQLKTVIQEMSSGLDNLAKGNLKYRLEEWFPVDFKGLRMDYNEAMNTIEAMLIEVAEDGDSIRLSADEITQATDDLARRTEQQAASLEQTAAALDEITATVRKTSEGAIEARDVVKEAKADAERSGTVVTDTVSAMSRIEDSSNKISNIIGVIDKIAFQTNLLALNAGVEAARAGDAGRGFAVVATEVRALAQRSADAAKEIKELISTSSQHVETGVRLVGDTGSFLGRIALQVNRLNTLVSEIAASAMEQSTALVEVNSAINQMDQMTQQNAAMVEQTTAASHSLRNETVSLASLLSHFKVGKVASAQNIAPPVRARANTPLQKLKTTPPFGERVRPVAAQIKPRTAVHVQEAETWDEF